MASGNFTYTSIPPSHFPYYFKLEYVVLVQGSRSGRSLTTERFTVSTAVPVGWNYNSTSQSAISTSMTLFSYSCPDLGCGAASAASSSMACAFCSNGGSFSLKATCQNCYMSGNFYLSSFRAQLGYSSVATTVDFSLKCDLSLNLIS